MKSRLFSLVLLLSLCANVVCQQKSVCHIQGEVIDRPDSKMLYLAPVNTDFRVADFIKIPIENNRFDYKQEFDNEEKYALAFEDEYNRGTWSPVSFMIEKGTVTFKLHPMNDVAKNSIVGTGKLNKALHYFDTQKKKSFDFESIFLRQRELPNKGLTPQAAGLKRQMDETDNTIQKDSLNLELRKLFAVNKIYSDEYNRINDEILEMKRKEFEWVNEYFKKNISIVGLCEISDRLDTQYQYRKIKMDGLPIYDTNKLEETFGTLYALKFPKHPTTLKIETLIASGKMQKGGKYIDFAAPDFNGVKHTLSKEIDGKIALIDLWASWCAPCRKKSKSMMPVYDEFKDKGFVIVGVARETEKKNGLNAIAQDKYTWLNLLELKDENKIWQKYGVGNSGGAVFLVDRDGTILEVDPTAEKVREILSEKLKGN